MEKIFKAKRLDDGQWHVFNMFDIEWSDHDSVRVNLQIADLDSFVFVSKNTICQFTGLYASNGRIFEGDYFDSVMIGDYEPMIRGAHVFFCPDELQWQGKLDDKNHCGQLSDYGIKLTGHNIHDKD